MPAKATNEYSPETRERAVRMVLDHEGNHSWHWTAVQSIAAKIGCSPHTLLDWVKKTEVDSGKVCFPRRGREHVMRVAATYYRRNAERSGIATTLDSYLTAIWEAFALYDWLRSVKKKKKKKRLHLK